MGTLVHPRYSDPAADDAAAPASRDSGRGLATLLLAAVVSALLVLANEVIGNWSDGHLLAGWIVLWSVAFAGLALLATPARQLAREARSRWAAWLVARENAANDARIWEAALLDGRIMADLSRAMAHDAADDVLQRS